MIAAVRHALLRFLAERRQRAYARRRIRYRRRFRSALSAGPVFTEKANPGGAK